MKLSARVTLFLLFALINSFAHGSLLASSDMPRTTLAGYVEYFEDSSTKIPADQILTIPNINFSAWANPTDFSQGFSKSAFWLKLNIPNTTANELSLLLDIPFPVLDDIKLYQQSDTELRLIYIGGDHLPFNRRVVDVSNSFIAPIKLAANSENTFFLRVQSTSSLTVPLYLTSYKSLLESQHIWRWVQGIFYGVLCGIIIYNSLLWIATRDNGLLFHAAHCASVMFSYLCIDGIGFELWPQSLIWQGIAVHFSVGLTLLCSVLFGRSLLGINASLPKQNTASLAMISLICLDLAACFILNVGDLGYASALISFAVIPYMMIQGVWSVRKRKRHAVLNFIAWTIISLSGSLVFFASLNWTKGFLDFNQALYIFQLAVLAHLILTSVAFGKRIHYLNKQRIRSVQERQLAEQQNRAKSDFLAKMSHEIRTPKTGVLGMAELLRSTKLNLEQSQYVDTSQGSSKVLLGVINDILDFSKLEAGRIQIEHIEFEPETLFSESVRVFKQVAAEKNVPIYFLIDDNVPKFLLGDPNRLRQIILNLLNNAVKFTDRGQIFVHVSVPYLTTVHCKLRVSVQDTGVGLSMEQQRQLFEPFSQADETTARKYGDTSLGLAICAQLIELMGGTIQAESTPGLGSQFRFTLQCAIGRSDVLAINSETERPTLTFVRPICVLVAEDHPANQKVMQAMLQKIGVETVLVQNGDLAIKQYLLNPVAFQIVFMDCEMPICDGLTATKQIREFELQRGLNPVPIIALTAHMVEQHRQQCFDSGANDVLVKPINMQQLQAKLEQWGKIDQRF